MINGVHVMSTSITSLQAHLLSLSPALVVHENNDNK